MCVTKIVEKRKLCPVGSLVHRALLEDSQLPLTGGLLGLRSCVPGRLLAPAET